MASFFGGPAQMPIFSIPWKDSISRAARITLNLRKGMRSSMCSNMPVGARLVIAIILP